MPFIVYKQNLKSTKKKLCISILSFEIMDSNKIHCVTVFDYNYNIVGYFKFPVFDEEEKKTKTQKGKKECLKLFSLFIYRFDKTKNCLVQSLQYKVKLTPKLAHQPPLSGVQVGYIALQPRDCIVS